MPKIPDTKAYPSGLKCFNFLTLSKVIPPINTKGKSTSFIILFKVSKETSLASTLALHELMFVKTTLGNKFLIWQPLFIIAGIYLLVTLILSYGVSLLEKRLSVSD